MHLLLFVSDLFISYQLCHQVWEWCPEAHGNVSFRKPWACCWSTESSWYGRSTWFAAADQANYLITTDSWGMYGLMYYLATVYTWMSSGWDVNKILLSNVGKLSDQTTDYYNWSYKGQQMELSNSRWWEMKQIHDKTQDQDLLNSSSCFPPFTLPWFWVDRPLRPLEPFGRWHCVGRPVGHRLPTETSRNGYIAWVIPET